jgi:hypothetical protein
VANQHDISCGSRDGSLGDSNVIRQRDRGVLHDDDIKTVLLEKQVDTLPSRAVDEDAGLMVPITRWIILRVVKLAGEWVRRLPANEKFFISINLSPTAALISNVGEARESLERLHAMGIQLMLDDFGTG